MNFSSESYVVGTQKYRLRAIPEKNTWGADGRRYIFLWMVGWERFQIIWVIGVKTKSNYMGGWYFAV